MRGAQKEQLRCQLGGLKLYNQAAQKLIDLKYHFVGDYHHQKRDYIAKRPDSDLAADICAKSFHKVKFEHHKNNL